MSSYIPVTTGEKKKMLDVIGVSDAEQLFSDIPEQIKLKRALDLPAPLSEPELDSHMKALSARNANADTHICFAGGGVYDHFIPAVVSQVVSRQEFYTAYTPYQAEISQGTLQAIFEYQTMICSLTGMDVSNASMYDGATALAEAMLLSRAVTDRDEVVIAGSVNGDYLEVCKTYARFTGMTLKIVPYDDKTGIVSQKAFEEALSERSAALIVQNPNYFGCLEELKAAGAAAKSAGALFVVSQDPISLGLFEAPGSFGADIVVGEGQGLGNPMNFGGPGFGFFACKNDYLRKMPGRIVGETTDASGKRGFVLTIQAREQHIRREKATSNICSNQALCALTATVYLSAMGAEGLKKTAQLCANKAHYMFDRLIKSGKFEPVFSSEFFKEFVVRYKGDATALVKHMSANGFMPGLIPCKKQGLENCLLIAVTEKRTKAEIDAYVLKAGELK